MKLITADKKQFAEALAIRFTVFVDEQGVPPELERDEFDSSAVHVLAIDGGKAVATARYIREGDSAHIGRVAVLKEYRGRGIGSALCNYIMKLAADSGCTEAVLGAQLSAIGFYQTLGFTAEGDVFTDAGILHRHMVKKL